MARKFTVDLAQLDEVIALLARFDTDAEELCGEVDQTVNRLHVSWSGEGACPTRGARAVDDWRGRDAHRAGEPASGGEYGPRELLAQRRSE